MTDQELIDNLTISDTDMQTIIDDLTVDMDQILAGLTVDIPHPVKSGLDRGEKFLMLIKKDFDNVADS